MFHVTHISQLLPLVDKEQIKTGGYGV